jgi:hypothetical protein
MGPEPRLPEEEAALADRIPEGAENLMMMLIDTARPFNFAAPHWRQCSTTTIRKQ